MWAPLKMSPKFRLQMKMGTQFYSGHMGTCRGKEGERDKEQAEGQRTKRTDLGE